MNPRQARIRTLLRSDLHRDGLSAAQIRALTGIPKNAVLAWLGKMGDVYIDRWQKKARGPGSPTAIYVAVDVPENCPRPGVKGGSR